MLQQQNKNLTIVTTVAAIVYPILTTGLILNAVFERCVVSGWVALILLALFPVIIYLLDEKGGTNELI